MADTFKPSILVIDDCMEVHDLVETRLRAEALSVYHALDGEEGVLLARRHRPDLVLLDLDLPGTPGLEVCRRLKADPLTAPLAIMFLTATADTWVKVAAFDLGAVDYVTKPFEGPELRARVLSTLRTKRYHDLLATNAQLDGLTGGWNRMYFEAKLAEEVSAAKRYGRSLGLVMVDIDHFKRINDEFGHPFGDMVLRRVAESLASMLRAGDACCRYGGEEFGIVLRETGLQAAVLVARRMRERLVALELRSEERFVHVTASLGVASSEQWPAAGELSCLRLLEAADGALYQAKRAGRDRVCCAGEVDG